MQLFSIIVFGCISSQGWRVDETTNKDYCLYNNDANACNYGVTIGVIGFLAAMGFIVGEYFFEQMSSVKTRKHYVLGDLGFSGECFNGLSCSIGIIHNLAFFCSVMGTVELDWP